MRYHRWPRGLVGLVLIWLSLLLAGCSSPSPVVGGRVAALDEPITLAKDESVAIANTPLVIRLDRVIKAYVAPPVYETYQVHLVVSTEGGASELIMKRGAVKVVDGYYLQMREVLDSSVEIVVSATPIPTPTARATATPSTPAPVVTPPTLTPEARATTATLPPTSAAPGGFKTYIREDGALAFRYPPDWALETIEVGISISTGSTAGLEALLTGALPDQEAAFVMMSLVPSEQMVSKDLAQILERVVQGYVRRYAMEPIGEAQELPDGGVTKIRQDLRPVQLDATRPLSVRYTVMVFGNGEITGVAIAAIAAKEPAKWEAAVTAILGSIELQVSTPTPTSTPTPLPTFTPTMTPTPLPTATPTASPTATSTPSAAERMNRGRAYYDQGDYESAASEFRAAVELEPDDAEAYASLGASYAKMNLHREAITAFKSAIRLDPQNKQAYVGLCALQAKLGLLDEAQETCERSLQLTPEDANAFNGMGLVYLGQERIEEAISAFQQAIRLDPRHEEAHNNQGRAYLLLGELDKARSEFKAVLDINPDNVSAHLGLGDVYAQTERRQPLAIYEYKKALKLAPGNVSAHFGLARAYQALARYGDAITEYEIVLRLRPDHPKKAQMETTLALLRRLQAGETYSTIGFEDTLPSGEERDVLFRAAPGGIVEVEVVPKAGVDVIVDIRKAETGESLATVNDFGRGRGEILAFQVPVQSGLEFYRITIRGDNGSTSYKVRVIGSAQIAFSILYQVDHYKAEGYLAQDAIAEYLYAGEQGDLLTASVNPRYGFDLAMSIRLLALDDPDTVLAEGVPKRDGRGALLQHRLPETGTYILRVSAVKGYPGPYFLIVVPPLF